MELLHNLAVGFGVALTPANLVFALAGALIGTLIGVLPGIGPIATIAMLLPLTFHLEPTSGLIMLAGIFYGAQYGGSTTAILVNLPGETSSVVTCIHGNTVGPRFTFGITELTDGIDVATLAIGIFGVGEIITNLTQPRETRSLATQKITRLWPTGEDFGRAWPAVLRGTGLGSVLGVLPGGGATLSAFAAYALEKRWSKHPAQFGHGAVEGVAGPESANNAG